jgi:pyridoxamine 5'-phosphate oxidase
VTARPLLERDLHPEPLKQFEAWFTEARGTELELPEAMALATVSAEGSPSVRMVLLKGFDERGFVFYSGLESRKARELDGNPRAALLFYWPPHGRQVRIEGTVEPVSREETEAYFATRPRGSQIGAWASRQSEPLASRDELEAAARDVAARFQGRELPLPPAWGGFRLLAARYEFWQHRDDRLHDRLVYQPKGDGSWRIERLSP